MSNIGSDSVNSDAVGAVSAVSAHSVAAHSPNSHDFKLVSQTHPLHDYFFDDFVSKANLTFKLSTFSLH